MKENYDHKEIEPKWQKNWQEKGIYQTPDQTDKAKYYVLDMFPYPSGDGLHVGHPKGYIATDVVSRTKRMQGRAVLHPMGWDAFGLPAENYAIKNKVHPRKAVEKNVARFKEQLSIIGLDYDWSREINTTDPEFYKWTQWIFLKLLEKGLAYESYEPINWCPSCQTGLANEDLEDGKCERCGSVVEKKPMRQWVLKITDYADRLLEDLKYLDKWPEAIKESQRNWIGRSEGAEISFKLISGSQHLVDSIKVFTTRADTLFGVTYIVVAPEHPEIENCKLKIENWDEVQNYINETKQKTEIERTDAKKAKTGVELKGLKAIHPATSEELPIWVADYVLGNYGTGAVMAVPAHDERDFAFAQKYNLPMKEVVIERIVDKNNPHRKGKETIFRDAVIALVRNPKTDKFLCLKWKKHPWVTFVMGGIEAGEDPIEAAKREIKEETGYKNVRLIKKFRDAQSEFFANHKDINRIAHTRNLYFELIDEEREEIDEAEKDIHEIEWRDLAGIKKSDMTHSEMPIFLDGIEEKEQSYTGEGLIINSGEFDQIESGEARQKITEKYGQKVTRYKLRDWVFSRQRYWGEPIPVIHCEKCGVVGVPEKDLPVKLPEVEHYEPAGTGESPLANVSEWVNIDCPKCGGKAKRETNTMPQWAGSSWYYLRFIDPKNDATFVDKAKEKYWSPVDMYVGGAEHATRHLIYARFWHKFLYDLGLVANLEPFTELHSVGLVLAEDGRKMSKRYGNVINPDDIVATFGADSLRLYEMFMGPFDNAIAWSTDNLVGVRRFLERVWKLSTKVYKGAGLESEKENKEKLSNFQAFKLETLLHKTIKKVTEDIENFKFNTAISAMMIFVNEIEKNIIPHEKSQGSPLSLLAFEDFLKLLAPFAPHMTEEIWYSLGHQTSIHLEKWPEFDQAKIVESEVIVVVQINGKVRAQFEAQAGLSEQEAITKALSLADISKWLGQTEPKKVIYIQDKLLNFVV